MNSAAPMGSGQGMQDKWRGLWPVCVTYSNYSPKYSYETYAELHSLMHVYTIEWYCPWCVRGVTVRCVQTAIASEGASHVSLSATQESSLNISPRLTRQNTETFHFSDVP